MVVVEEGGRYRRVLDASAEATACGVRRGMTPAEARALCPGVRVVADDPVGDRRALDALGRWMTRFTPVVATGWSPATADDPGRAAARRRKKTPATQQGGASSPPLLFLDVTGCERTLGGIGRIVADVTAALARFGVPASVAVAPTPGAAWAFAVAGGRSGRIVGSDGLREALAPLPVRSLRLDADAVAALNHLGLRTIGQLFALPRETLPARFGPTLLVRLDQATGARPEVLVPLAYEPPVEARMEFDGPVRSLEAVWAVLAELLARVVDDLARRGRGARRLDLTFTPGYVRAAGAAAGAAGRAAMVTKAVALSRPSRDPAHLFNLVRTATEHLEAREGLLAIHLKVSLHERVSDEQTSLLDGESDAGRVELDHLIEQLCVRLGREAVVRPALVESHLPERAWAAAGGAGPTVVATAAATAAAAAAAGRAGGARPLHLLPVPVPVRVLAEPSDDAEGRPRQFAHEGRVHRLAHAVGPERLAGEWWRGHRKTRDYYDVEDEAGRRFWLFRVVTPRPDPAAPAGAEGQTVVRWFLHGRFE